jgi:hypothetical protein
MKRGNKLRNVIAEHVLSTLIDIKEASEELNDARIKLDDLEKKLSQLNVMAQKLKENDDSYNTILGDNFDHTGPINFESI